jgi:hypothetical protein
MQCPAFTAIPMLPPALSTRSMLSSSASTAARSPSSGSAAISPGWSFNISRLVVPAPAEPGRADELWRSTCFELFVAGEGAAYREYNFSPSGQWAAYEFDDYRSGMRHIDAQIETELYQENNILQFSAEIRTEFANPAHVGLTAVIEETDRHIRYWSTAFAPGKPDFHAAAVRSLLFDGVSAE